MGIVYFIEIAVFAFFSFSVFYLFLFAVAGDLARAHFISPSPIFRDVLVLIPSYMEDKVIVSSALATANLNYPKEKFKVAVLADSLKLSTIEKLNQIDNIDVIEVSFEKSTKVKSLKTGVEKYKDFGFDFILILDADNLAEENFLFKLNDAFEAGYRSVQGKRVAKNFNTGIAVLDGLSEAINNHIFRKGYNALGVSSSLIGSGMAFDFKLFTSIILNMNSIGGFDRELHAILLNEGVKTKYVEDAIIYDEKVDNTKSLENQRKRWISSQFFYLKKYFIKGLKELFKGNFNYFDATVLSNLILPRILLLGILIILCILTFFLNAYLSIPFYYWIFLLSLLIFTLLISIPSNFYNYRTLKSVILLPLSFFTLLKSLIFSWNSNKDFIHTPHGVQKVDSKIK